MLNLINNFTFNYNIQASPGQLNPSKNSVIMGHRTTAGDLILANSGYPQPNLYQPILLQPYPNGASALSYMQQLGFNVSYGNAFTLNLPAPSLVTLQNNGNYLIQWTTVPSNFTSLTLISFNGTITQGIDTGTIVSVAITTGIYLAQMIVTPIASSTFNTSTAITLTGTVSSSYPNPVLTDEICMNVWYFYQSASSLPRSPNGQPAAIISVLSDRDTTHSPNSTPFALVAPTSEVPTGNTVILTYPTSAANLGYLPLTPLGNTVFTQAVSTATGIYNGMTINNGIVSISLTNTTGTWNTTNTVSVALDSSYNVFSFLMADFLQCKYITSPYEWDTSSSYTTYADFITGVNTLNNGTFIMQNKYFVRGIMGNINTTPVNANTLPNIVNLPFYVQPTYPYIPMFLDLPFSAGALAAVQAYVGSNVDVPYPPQDGVYVSVIPISSNTQNRYSNATANVALNQGWNPWAINTNGQAYIVRDQTALVTIPNTNIPDNEFRFQHVWDVVGYIAQDTYQVWEVASTSPVINGGRVFNSPTFQASLENQLVGRLYIYESLGMAENVSAYASLLTVVTNPSSPTGVAVTIPIQIIPGLGSANVTLNLFSIYQTFTTQA